MHEYGHILLNIPSLCIPDSPTTDRHGFKVEKWCNQFAASFLLPSDIVTKEFESSSMANYGKIANRYKVSNFATLIRLYSLKLINDQQFQDAVNVLKSREVEQRAKDAEKRAREAEKEKQSTGGGEPSSQRVKREMGDVYVSLVIQNSQKGFITYSRALDYLNIKTKHLKKLMNNM
jgi:Zn-dependent peptidase ImmA (M78 family)